MSKAEKEEKKRRAKVPVYIWIIVAVLLGVFGFSAYKIIDQVVTDAGGEDTYEKLADLAKTQSDEAETREYIRVVLKEGDDGSLVEVEEKVTAEVFDVDFDALRESNGDVTAWLYSPDTIVNYPVAQADDNDKYLRHLLDGSYHRFGTLFFDYRNDLQGDVLNDDISMIYGHNIRAGDMFHEIEEYTDQSYYEEHPYMMLYMPGADYRLDIFAMVTVNEEEELRFAYPDEAEGWIQRQKDRSFIETRIKVTPEDRIVGLLTCTNEDKSDRYILYAKATLLLEAGN